MTLRTPAAPIVGDGRPADLALDALQRGRETALDLTRAEAEAGATGWLTGGRP